MRAPVVEVFDDPGAAGVPVPTGVIPKGVTLTDGRIPTWHIWDDFIRHF